MNVDTKRDSIERERRIRVRRHALPMSTKSAFDVKLVMIPFDFGRRSRRASEALQQLGHWLARRAPVVANPVPSP